MTRLDHNRAKTQLAAEARRPRRRRSSTSTIWGNHSTTRCIPTSTTRRSTARSPLSLVDEAWITDTFIPTVATRGGAIIKARGLSSAASAANATIDHMRDWILGTDDWVSMSVPSDGSYGVTEGIVSSFPCVCKDGAYEIVQGIELSDFSRERIMASVARLESERDQVKALGLI
ncbi:MAG: hypothetical protein V9F04_10230 [Dermatophilaceae bacterium]